MSPNTTAIILDVLFIVIAAIFIAVGVKRGFIKSLIQSAKLILTVIVTYFLGSSVATFLKDKFIFKSVYDFWYSKIDNIYQSANASLNTEEFRKTIESAPNFLLNPDKKAEILEATSEEAGTALVESVSTSIATPMADVVSNILGYVLTFVLAFVALTIVAWLLTKLADRIAFIGTANRILGGVFGALVGVIVLTIIAAIIGFIDVDGVAYPSTVIVKLLGDFLK